MWTIAEMPKFLKCASGDAVATKYIKRIYVWYQGFGLNKKYEVRVDVDGTGSGDRPVVVDIFDNVEDAKNFISELVELHN